MKKKKVKKLPFVVILSLICIVFGSLYLFDGYFEKKKDENNPDILEKEEPKSKEYSTSFTLGGNVLINSNMWYDTVSSDGSYEFDHVFEDLNDIMKKSNINFYFQQSILGGKDLGLSLNFRYNSPIDVLDSLSQLGFNALSLGSYHAYDKGISGITNAVKYLNDKNIAYSGVNETEEGVQNNIIEKNGIKIGVLSYTSGTDEIVSNLFAVDVYSDKAVKLDVESLQNKVDAIMVTIDWTGLNNYSSVVNEEQKRVANYLSSLGVDIVVGNTGYSIQPIEIVNNTLVCYSLGNLLSGHFNADYRISSMVDFDLKITKTIDQVEISFEDINVLLTYAYNSNNTNYKVIPFTKLSTELPNYQIYYDKYKNLLSVDDKLVNVYPIGD